MTGAWAVKAIANTSYGQNGWIINHKVSQMCPATNGCRRWTNRPHDTVYLACPKTVPLNNALSAPIKTPMH